jgi:hypothetical protein
MPRRTFAALSAAAAMSLALALGSGATAAGAAPSAHAACGGRALLLCSEKQQILPDITAWTNGFVLDAELFEAPQVHVYNPALIQFWRWETTTAAARSLFESLLFKEFVTDQNFENLAVPPKLPAPVVRPSGIIDRKFAGAMSALLQAELREIGNLEALDTSLDRAQTAKFMRGRADWVAWQQSAAAGFANRAAGSIGSVIFWERIVSAGLMKRNRPFGVGSTDLKLAQRQVSQHGFAAPLVADMTQLQLAGAVGILQSEFEHYSFGTFSFNVSQVLGQGVAAQQGLSAALRHYAARIPASSKPPA